MSLSPHWYQWFQQPGSGGWMWRRERGKMKRLHNMQENPSCLVGGLPILFKTCSLLDCFVCVQRDYGVGIIKNRHCNKKMAMNSASLSGNLSSSSEAAAWAPAAIMSLQPRISIRPALLSLSPWYTSYSSHIIQVMYIFSWGNYLLHSLFVSGVVPVSGLVGNEPACSYPAVRIRIISSRILSVFFSACKDDLFFFASEVCQQYMKIPDPSLASLLICHGWRGLFTDQELMRTGCTCHFLLQATLYRKQNPMFESKESGCVILYKASNCLLWRKLCEQWSGQESCW